MIIVAKNGLKVLRITLQLGERLEVVKLLFRICFHFDGIVVTDIKIIKGFLSIFQQSWYAKTPLGKKRTKAASGKEEEEAPKDKNTKKKGKK